MKEYSIDTALCILDADLGAAIEERLSLNSEFTTVTLAAPNNIPKIALTLVRLEPDSFKGSEPSFTHIGILRKGQRVATNQVRIKVTDVIEIPSIPISTIFKKIPPALSNSLKDIAHIQYSKIPSETAKALFDVVIKTYPTHADRIKRLHERLRTSEVPVKARLEDAAIEKDATGICLDIFGIDRSKVMRNWNAKEGINGNSFLSGLVEYAVNEDQIIAHDLNTLPGWQQLSKYLTGVVEFINEDDERLLIINSNRTPIEKALGVDLIYYHRKFQAFTFVQYKMMDRQTSSKSFYYNPRQGAHDNEIARMDDFFRLLTAETPTATLVDYRFSDCPLFFKLCKKIQLKANESTIAHGAYISLNHWNILLKDESIRGPHGGLQIGFHTLGRRYIGTHLFVELVQKGLLGTSVVASQKVALFIEDSIANGHSIIFAIDESDKSNSKARNF